MNQFICYSKCSTCQKAKKFLLERNIIFQEIEIKENPPKVEDLRQYIKLSGKSLKNFFNTSGLIYKEMNLKDKLDSMTEDEQLNLLSSNGMLIKRPIFVANDFVLIGFKEKEYLEYFGDLNA